MTADRAEGPTVEPPPGVPCGPRPLTEGLAGFVASPGFDAVPPDVVPVVRNGFVDTLAALLGGRDEPVTRAALAFALRRRGAGEATLLLGRERSGVSEAAFANATAAHALDFDDMALNGHPSVVLVPALLAAGEPLAATPSACDAVRASSPRRCATAAAAATVPITPVGCQPLPCIGSGSRAASSAQTS